MKKIVFYFPHFNEIGGVEEAIYSLIQKLPKEEFDITVCYSQLDSNIDQLLRMSKYATVKLLDNVIESDKAILCSALCDKSKFKTKKLIKWMHGCMIELDINCKFQDDADYICVSEASANDLKERFNIDAKVIYNEMNDDMFEKSKEKIYLSKEDLTLVTVSRISPEKGFERIYKIANWLIDKNKKFVWYILGNGYDKEYEKYIKDLFVLIPQVKFIGVKSNPYPYIKSATYLVQTSTSEARCYSIEHAKLLGIPVICTDFNSAYEQITEGVNGYILKRDLSDLDDRIFNIPSKFEYKYESNIDKWLEILRKED